jgi:hypothetical protein
MTEDDRSNIIDIRTITNNILFPVQVINGENTSQTWTIPGGGGLNEPIWLHFAFSEADMWGCLRLIVPEFELTMHLYAWNAVAYYSLDGKWASGRQIPGGSNGNGRKALTLKRPDPPSDFTTVLSMIALD